MRFLPVVLLLACHAPGADPVTEAAWGPDAAVDVAPPPGVPLVLGHSALYPGLPATFTISDADPSERVHLLRSQAGVGAGPCPAQIGGQCLGILSPVVSMGSAWADGAGVATVAVNVPGSVPVGAQAHFQAVAVRGPGGQDSVMSQALTGTVEPAPWSNEAIVIDGSLTDFDVFEERFDTTSGAPTHNYVTWDATNLYVGFLHPDVAAGTPLHWTTIYVGTGQPGSLLGVVHNTQQPALPFEATHMLRWKADDSYDSLEVWDGYGWSTVAGYLGTNGSDHAWSNAESSVEFQIPRSLFGGATVLDLHLAWVYEGDLYESTYAGTPSDSFVDGYDPDFSTHLTVDLASPASPAAQNP